MRRGVPIDLNDYIHWLKLLKAQNSDLYAQQSATVDQMIGYLEKEPLSPSVREGFQGRKHFKIAVQFETFQCNKRYRYYDRKK